MLNIQIRARSSGNVSVLQWNRDYEDFEGIVISLLPPLKFRDLNMVL